MNVANVQKYKKRRNCVTAYANAMAISNIKIGISTFKNTYLLISTMEALKYYTEIK